MRGVDRPCGGQDDHGWTVENALVLMGWTWGTLWVVGSHLGVLHHWTGTLKAVTRPSSSGPREMYHS